MSGSMPYSYQVHPKAEVFSPSTILSWLVLCWLVMIWISVGRWYDDGLWMLTHAKNISKVGLSSTNGGQKLGKTRT